MTVLILPDAAPCDGCGQPADMALVTPEGYGMALCGPCRLRAEATLRGARKGGPRVGQWGTGDLYATETQMTRTHERIAISAARDAGVTDYASGTRATFDLAAADTCRKLCRDGRECGATQYETHRQECPAYGKA